MTIINRPKFEKPVVRRNFRQNPIVTKKERQVLDSIFAICDSKTSLEEKPEIDYILIKDNRKVLCYEKKPNSLLAKPSFILYPAKPLVASLSILINETLYNRN